MSNPLICYLSYCINPPSLSAIEEAVKSVYRQGERKLPVTATKSGITVATPVGQVLLTELHTPFPTDELTDDLAQRQVWPTWRDDSEGWRSHIVATIISVDQSPSSLRQRAHVLLKMTAVLARSTRASGVGLSSNLLFFPIESFMSLVDKSDLPTEILVRCIWRQASHNVGLKTEGLGAFLLPEIDHPPSGESAEIIYNRVMNLCTYMIDKNVILNHADTIGVDNRRTMRVRHSRDAAGTLTLLLDPIN